jgi:hypothetical protein
MHAPSVFLTQPSGEGQAVGGAIILLGWISWGTLRHLPHLVFGGRRQQLQRLDRIVLRTGPKERRGIVLPARDGTRL